MPELYPALLLGLVVLITNFQEGVTGFGCTVLALPFATLILGRLDSAKYVLVMLAWTLGLIIVSTSRKHIVWKEYARVGLMVGVGLPVGIWMAESLPEEGLRWVLAVFMVIIGVHGLLRQCTQEAVEKKMSARTRFVASSLLPLGGIIHGAFGSGGPLVVVYATRALPNKSVFRVTLSMMFLTLNTLLITRWVLTGQLTTQSLHIALGCLPFTLLGVTLGSWAHHRIAPVFFRRMVYTVLILSGIAVVWMLLR